MAGTAFDLAKLLQPAETSAFLRDTWEQEPLVLRRSEPGYYVQLFSLADVDQVIAFSRPRFTEAGVFRHGPPAARTYVQGWLPDRQLVPAEAYPDIGELRGLFAQGKSIILRSMQRRWPAIASLCRNLEGIFQCPVHANLYLTPPGSQGFEPHLDTHEVFALQLHGAKTWRLYGPAAELPLAEDKMSLPRSRLGSPREVCLETGDLLYLPRGHAHEAFTTDCMSLHLTVGVNIYRWADLLQEALKVVTRRDARFRQTLPHGTLLGTALPAGVPARFQELLQALVQAARPEEAARCLGNRFFDELTMLPAAAFVPPEGIEQMHLDTELMRRPEAICRVLVEGEETVIEFPGGLLSGPSKIAPALAFVAGTERFAVRELPDNLGDDAKLVLARRLVREGLLSIIRPSLAGQTEAVKGVAISRQLASV